MAKPRLIILIRHAQSEGNKNREIHQTVPDHRVKLTQEGWQQAYDAGRRLRALLRADDSVQFFTSPYRRTRETTEAILATLTSDDPEPSPFKRNNIKVYEEPRLREQDFGNFQPCSAEMERMWQERADYGHFFYRILNGESAADAYDRISGFNESLWRQFGDDDFASVCVLVTHGLMSRVFLMKWYHWGVEYFEDLCNVNHCEFLIMRRQPDSGKYLLENKLRTWSELRRERERALQQQQKENVATSARGGASGSGSSSGLPKEAAAAAASSPVVHRRWGGCPNGCNHAKAFRIRSNLADLVKRDDTAIVSPSNTIAPGSVNGIKNPATAGPSSSSSTTNACNPAPSVPSSLASRRPAARRFQSSGDDTEGEEDVVLLSSDGTPPLISVDDRLRGQLKSPAALDGSERPRPLPIPAAAPPLLHIGRDFGGSYSGHSSLAGSDAESSEDERLRRQRCGLARMRVVQEPSAAAGAMMDFEGEEVVDGGPDAAGSTEGAGAARLTEHKRQHSGMRRGVRVNRLGDSPQRSDCEHCGRERGDEEGHGNDGGEVVAHDQGGGEAEEDDDDDDLAAAEREDKSFRGSVY